MDMCAAAWAVLEKAPHGVVGVVSLSAPAAARPPGGRHEEHRTCPERGHPLDPRTQSIFTRRRVKPRQGTRTSYFIVPGIDEKAFKATHKVTEKTEN